jgi:hypothetical protein
MRGVSHVGRRVRRRGVDDPEYQSTSDLAAELLRTGRELAAAQCRWLTLLAEFDRRAGWAADGALSCVDWLVWRVGLARSTAKEKLRVAHELRRRPIMRDAFAAGDVSYSKVRAITRVVGADAATDRQLLELARDGTTADVERVVRHFEQLQEQERGVDDYLRRFDRRSLRAARTFDGMMVIEMVLPIEEGEELLRHVRAAEAVDKASAESASTGPGQRRVDALLDLVRAGDGQLEAPPRAADPDRYTLHLVADVDALADRGGRAELVDGTPVSLATISRVACDCGVVRHLMRGPSQPLDLGRHTPVWSTAQRRAIMVRDRGRCRFPSCWRRTCEVHHVVHFARGGPTAIDNGILLCPRHHTLVHEGGFTISGDPPIRLTFHRADGTAL